MAESKKFMTRVRPGGSLYEIYFEGGGEVPEYLKGAYTSSHRALAASEEYVSTYKRKTNKKVKSDGEDSSK